MKFDSYSRLQMLSILNQVKDVVYNVDTQSEVVEQSPLFAIGYTKGAIARLTEMISQLETQ